MVCDKGVVRSEPTVGLLRFSSEHHLSLLLLHHYLPLLFFLTTFIFSLSSSSWKRPSFTLSHIRLYFASM